MQFAASLRTGIVEAEWIAKCGSTLSSNFLVLQEVKLAVDCQKCLLEFSYMTQQIIVSVQFPVQNDLFQSVKEIQKDHIL